MTDQLSKVFAALSDPLRRDMVTRLTRADATVSELAEPYDVSMQAVSKHLKVLEDAGLVASKIAQDVVAQVLGTRIPIARRAENSSDFIAEFAQRRD